MPTPIIELGEKVLLSDLDDAANRSRENDTAVLLAVYKNQNTATTAAPRLRKRLEQCRTADGRALNLTSREVDGVSGVFAYLTDVQLNRLVSFHLYADADGPDGGRVLDDLNVLQARRVRHTDPGNYGHMTADQAARIVAYYAMPVEGEADK